MDDLAVQSLPDDLGLLRSRLIKRITERDAPITELERANAEAELEQLREMKRK